MKLIALANKLSHKYADDESFEDEIPTIVPPPMEEEHTVPEAPKSRDVIVASHLISSFEKLGLLDRGATSYYYQMLDEQQDSKGVLAGLASRIGDMEQNIAAAKDEITKWQGYIR